MKYGVMLNLSEEGQEHIQRLRSLIIPNNNMRIIRQPAHISIAFVEELKMGDMKFAEEMEKFAHEIGQIPVKLSSLGVFDNAKKTIFMGAEKSQALVDANYNFYNYVTGGFMAQGYCIPGKFTPHVSLAKTHADMDTTKVIRQLEEAGAVPFDAIANRLTIRFDNKSDMDFARFDLKPKGGRTQ